jgi:leucyl/phenylalanyl-tRNA--protein transferase
MTQLTNNQSSSNKLYWVADNVIADTFPPVETALHDPNGLLAIGGDLSADRLLDAYGKGIFPWYSQGQPILWWSPDPRCVLIPNEMYISKSLKKLMRKNKFIITNNKAFDDVISKCAEPRNGNPDTWITNEINDAYKALNNKGHILSIEVWHNNYLVGGLYGVVLGKVFFGESMFSNISNASKVALAHLADLLKTNNFKLIDCQIYSKHLQSLGAKPMQRNLFINTLKHYCNI